MTTFSNNVFFWQWWESQENQGRYISKGWRFQRERWHLLALHSSRFLGPLSKSICDDLSLSFGDTEVSIQSVWVDQTPQAETRYINSAGEFAVKCELGDLIVITEISFADAPVQPEDRRAVLVQAKVTSAIGQLEGASRGSSSYKERNLLELCSQEITLSTGTRSSKKIGTFNLGCTPSSRGLGKLATYLTIPKSYIATHEAPYQAMWPASRDVELGSRVSWSTAIAAMLRPRATNAIGAPLSGTGANKGWSQMVQALTKEYDLASVKRFPRATGAGFPRVQSTSVRYGGAAKYADPTTSKLFYSDAGWLSLSNGGNGQPPESNDFHDNEDDMPSVPYLFVRAHVRRQRDEVKTESHFRSRQ